MSIVIITDSASDIAQNEFENVRVLPLSITIGEHSYRDGIDITKDQFYNVLQMSDTMPQSGLANTFAFEQAYDDVKAAGDEAIVLPISSELSGTYKCAVLAAEGRPEISVLDTQQVSASQRLLVLYARRLIEQGLKRAEIVAELEAAKKRLVIFAAVDTLKYLLKGGRISKGSAIIGGIIGIKPIVTLENGRLIAIGKARGSRQSNIFLNEKIREVGGIDAKMPMAVGYSGTDDTNLRKYMESNNELVKFAGDALDIVQIGTAVGTHAGPGAVLVAFFANRG